MSFEYTSHSSMQADWHAENQYTQRHVVTQFIILQLYGEYCITRLQYCQCYFTQETIQLGSSVAQHNLPLFASQVDLFHKIHAALELHFHFYSSLISHCSQWQFQCQLVIYHSLWNNKATKIFSTKEISGVTEMVQRNSYIFFTRTIHIQLNKSLLFINFQCP